MAEKDDVEPAPEPEDRGKPKRPARGRKPKPKPAPEPGPEPEPEAPRVEEVEATPLGEGERAEGPTIDAPPPPGGSGDAGGGPAPGRSHQWAALTHVAGLASLPFLYVGGIVGPLIVWQLKEGDEPDLAHHGKEAINFQVNMLVWTLLTTAFAAVVSYVPCCCVAWILPVLVQVWNVAFTVIAAVRASEGELFRYPGILRVL